MKSLLIFLIPIFVFSQNKKLVIDLNNDVQNQEIIVKNGMYDLEVNIKMGTKLLEFKMSRGVGTYDNLVLKTQENDSINQMESIEIERNLKIDSLRFKSSTIYTFSIKLNDSGTIENRKYVFKSESTWDWSNTFGVNAIFLLNSDSYKTIANSDQFQIVGDSGQKILQYVPSVMYTFMDRSKNVSLGFSSGLGFDLEKISVFVGGSVGIGQNFVATAGVAFHNQERLDSKYVVMQSVDSSLSFDDLHEGYYRFNPFVSMALKLDKRPNK